MSENYDINNLVNICGEQKTDVLISYLKEILEINKFINLTSIRNFDDALLLHIEDSLSALHEFENAIEGPYLDMGCGGGFPGVPLAVASGRDTTLIDSKTKKINAIINAILSNNISSFAKITLQPIRIEEFSKNHKEEFAIVTARALSSLASIIELASPLLKIGGTLICLKGNLDESELQQAEEIRDDLGYSEFNIRKFYLSDGVTFREVLSIKKLKNAKIDLPRRDGQAQNSPLNPNNL